MLPELWVAVALLLTPLGDPAKSQARAPAGAAIDGESQPLYSIVNGKGGARILLDQASAPGLKEAALSEIVFLPGATVPEHVHDQSAELIYVLEGHGTMTLGDKVVQVKPGMAIYIPPGMKHSFKLETQVQPLRAIQIYTPGGPEQRFKSGAALKE